MPVARHALVLRERANPVEEAQALLQLGDLREHLDPEEECTTKQAMFERIKAVPRQGAFSAYQVVVDLQYTYLLRSAPDLNSFTVAGPGCARGLGRAFNGDPDHFNCSSRRDQAEMLRRMVESLETSRDP